MEPQEQNDNRPWLFKKGQSGNPGGRPKGSKSLKQRAREYLEGLSDEEAIEYFDGLNKLDVWKMGEGNPKQDTDVTSGGEKIQFNVISYEDNYNSISVLPEELPTQPTESETKI